MGTMRRDDGNTDGNQRQSGREAGRGEPESSWRAGERRPVEMPVQGREYERADYRGYDEPRRGYEEAQHWDRGGSVGLERGPRYAASDSSREPQVGERGVHTRGPSDESFRGRREEGRETSEQRHGGGSLIDRFRRWRHGVAQARDVMTRHIRGVRPNDSVQHVAQIMVDEDTGVVPVLGEGNRLLGIVTDRDIVCRVIPRGVDVRELHASDVMTRDVECVTEQTSVFGIMRVMRERQVRRVPVVARGDRLVGIVSMADIAREADADRELRETFQEISTDRGYWSGAR